MAVAVPDQHSSGMTGQSDDSGVVVESRRATRVHDTRDLSTLLPDWIEFLNNGTVGHNVHNDPYTISGVLVRQPKLQPLIISVWRDSQLECIAPFYLQTTRFLLEMSIWKLPAFQSRALRLFGERILFSRNANKCKCLGLVLDTLKSVNPKFDYLQVVGLEQSDCLWTDGIDHQMCQQLLGTIPVVMRAEKVHQIELPKSLDAYMASLSPSTRQNLRRTTRRFFEDGKARIAKCTQPNETAKLLDWIEQVSRNSWQGHTLGSDSRNADSQRLNLQDIAERGWLQSYVLLRNDEPIAFEHGYLYRNTYYGLECAYDQRWSQSGPGSVLMYSVVQDLLAEGSASTLDFGFGDMPYKRSFGNVEIPAATVYFPHRKRWRIIFQLQTFLNLTYDVVRNALIRLHIDRVVRRIVKRKK